MARRIQLEIVGDSRSAERAFRRAGTAADRFHRKIGKLGKKGLFGGKMRGLARIGGIGAVSGGAGLVGAGALIGVSAAKGAASFEKSMSRIVGLAGQSQAQVQRWGNQIIALGPQIGKTPQELADALYFIASSGVPASKAIDALTASAKASAAGLGETEVVADAITSVMNAYAKQGMTAAHATDVLVATVREGKGEADQFAGVIGNVAAFASKLNVPFEQVGAALAAMTQLGTDPRTAATQLQAFFGQMLQVTGPMRKRAEEMGFMFDDATDMLTKGDLIGALQNIKGQLQDNPLFAANLFPNKRALRAVLALTAEDGGKVAAVFARMNNSVGASGHAFAAAQKTSSHHMEQMRASWEALKIAFGQGLLPLVNAVAVALGKKFADPKFVATVREMGRLVGTVLLQAFRSISAWFSAHWGDIKGGVKSFVSILRSAINIAKTLKNVLVTITTPLRIQFKILMAIWDKILAAVSTGAGIASHLPFVGDKFKDVQEAVDSARGVMRDPLGGGGGKRKKPPKPSGPFYGGRHARGGAVFPGMSYMVGERGPEMFVSGTPGNIVPIGAGGGGGDLVINLDGREIARATLPHITRHAKHGSAQSRGGHAGQRLALN